MSFQIRLLVFLLSIFPLIPINGQNIETVVQTGHYAAVTAVCYSADGNFITTGSSDKTIKLWRSSDGKEIRSFPGNDDGISYVEFNKQGTLILLVCENGTLTVWDLLSGKLLKKLIPAGDRDRYTCASFHPERQLIIAGSRKSGIKVFDIKTGNKISEFEATPRDHHSEKAFHYPEARTISKHFFHRT